VAAGDLAKAPRANVGMQFLNSCKNDGYQSEVAKRLSHQPLGKIRNTKKEGEMSKLSELMSRDLNTENSIERPGCITYYSIFLGIVGGIFGLLISFVGILSIKENIFSGMISIIMGIAFTIFYVFIAIGLWKLKKWSRITLIILQGLGMLVYYIRIIITLLQKGKDASSTTLVFTICGILAITLVSGSILLWFIRNGKYFKK
jgi:hypothetical protein